MKIYMTAGSAPCAGGDAPAMTLDDLVIAVERHRRQMAPLVSGLSHAVHSDDGQRLISLLEDNDRELGRLSDRLRDHLGRHSEPTGRCEPWM